MNSRQRLKAIIAGEKADRCGFWMGNPHPDTWPIYFKHFGVDNDEDLRLLLNDDFRWICPEWEAVYRHPQGKPIWDMQPKRTGLSAPGVFSDCESVEAVDAFDWPNPDYLDFAPVLEKLDNAGDFYRASGMWSPFFHIVAEAFGMENYFMKMYTHPEVVEAVTRRVCEFYLKANDRFFALAGDRVDAFFFGNDFGSQLDLLVSENLFDQFIMPWFRKFTAQGHAAGYQVILHSCGSIYRVIDRLIDSGVNALHPLQAKAAGMDAASLEQNFKGRITFLGGIDTQDLLVHATPDQITAEVARVRAHLGERLIISPSHECLLPNVPPENVLAMARAARD